MSRTQAFAGLVLLATGCVTPIGARNARLPADAADTCRQQCRQIGMKMNAVAIMAANVGCICGDVDSPQAAAASSAGMATIMLQQAEEERQHIQQQQQQRSFGPR